MAFAVLRRLALDESATLDVRNQLATAANYVGQLLLEQGNAAGAHEHYTLSAGIYQSALAEDPDTRDEILRDLAAPGRSSHADAGRHEAVRAGFERCDQHLGLSDDPSLRRDTARSAGPPR